MTAEKELTDRYRDDHTKTIVVVVLCVLVCGGLVGAGFQVRESWRQFANPSNITATAPVELMAEVATLKPTATSTATPWPTADLRYLESAKAEAEIAQSKAQAEQQIANAQSTQLSNLQTAEAIEINSDNLTATMRADMTATESAYAAIATPAHQQLIAGFSMATSTQKALDSNQAVATTGTVTLIIAAGVLAVVVIIVAGVIIAAKVSVDANEKVANMQKVYEGRDQEVVTNAGAGGELSTENDIAQINHSQNEAYLKEIAITREEKALIRRAAVEYGGRFSNETMTPKEKFFSDYRWRQIEDLLLDHSGPDSISYAVRLADRSVGLTSDGWDWLGLRQPAPSPVVTTPENAQKTAEDHHTTPQNTEGEAKEEE